MLSTLLKSLFQVRAELAQQQCTIGELRMQVSVGEF
jgi:hypothetical protein